VSIRIRLILLGLLLTCAFVSFLRAAQDEPFSAPKFYTKNCLGCHGSAGQKNFNPDLPEEQMIDTILNGLPMPEPPDMPAFKEKGINEERAKILIAHIRTLRAQPQ
jgi:mono/diheme cytochrome c family protein